MYTLEQKQVLNISLEKAWEFFSSPKNLQKITPETMDFSLISTLPKQMYSGMFIYYKIKPFRGFQTYWLTEITHSNPPYYFIDEQRKGPYKWWHHEHHFKSIDAHTTEMKDKLYYEMPFGILGKLVHSLFVRMQIEKIFNFRYQKLEELFNQK